MRVIVTQPDGPVFHFQFCRSRVNSNMASLDFNVIPASGAPGVGVPAGGTTGQVPTKASNADYDIEWSDPSGVTDVQINGTSIVQDGVANVPIAGASAAGVVVVRENTDGLKMDNANHLCVASASSSQMKAGSSNYRPITPYIQHESAFYALAKAAGDSSQSSSSNPVGQYTDVAKSAISDMLNAPETVTGSTPSITAKSGVRYICGECATLTITVPASGIIDVVFESGATPTVLTVTPPTGMTMKWANSFDPTALDANTTYEINIMDGVYGVVGKWA